MMENAKRPTELQGGPVLIQELGLDFQDGSGPVARLAHDGKALLLKALAVDEAYPDEVQAPVAVLPLPRIAHGTNVASRSGLQTLQGVTLADGDLVLLFGQSTQSQNGLWQAHANVDGVATSWTRSKLPYYSGQLFAVQEGTYAGQMFRRTNVGTITEGVTAQSFDVLSTVASSEAGTTGPVLRKVSVTIPFASVRTLNATPYEVIPAPAAGYYNEVVGIHAWLDYGSAAYDGVGGTEVLCFKYTDGSGAKATSDIASTGFGDATSDQHRLAVPAGVAPVAAAAVVAHLAVGEWYAAAGNSPLKIEALYRVRPIEF